MVAPATTLSCSRPSPTRPPVQAISTRSAILRHDSDHLDLTADRRRNQCAGLGQLRPTRWPPTASAGLSTDVHNQTIVYVNTTGTRQPRRHGNPPDRHEHQSERKRHPSSYVAAIDRAADVPPQIGGFRTIINAARVLRRQNPAFVSYLMRGAAIFGYSGSP